MAKCSSKSKELILNLWRDREKRAQIIKKTLGVLWWGVLISLAALMFSIIGAKFRGEIPMIFGHSIMKIVSGSMETEIPEGSYILIKKVDPSEVEKNDVITFFSSDYAIYGLPNTHRVVEPPIIGDNGIEFVTRGDANPVNDKVTAKGEDLIGIYVKRLDGLTAFAKALEGGGMMVLMLVLEAFIFAMAAMMFIKTKRAQLAKENEKEKEDETHEREKLD